MLRYKIKDTILGRAFYRLTPEGGGAYTGGPGPKYTTNWLILPHSAIWPRAKIRLGPRAPTSPVWGVLGGQLSPIEKQTDERNINTNENKKLKKS